VRVVHLSTSKFGGAGKSASILNQKLIEAGIISQLLDRRALGIQKTLQSKGATIYGKLSSTPEYDFLSSHSVSTLDFRALHELRPQIIHVHNWYNLISVEDFSQLAQIAPLVFTLHDERLATGGCHVTLGCRKFLKSCNNCPAHRFGYSREKYRKRLENFFDSGQNYSVISPSLWMMEQLSLTSLVSKAYSTKVIPNLLSSANKILPPGQPKTNSTELIFVASNIDVPYKGIQTLLSAMSILDPKMEGIDKQLNLTLVGHSNVKKVQFFKNIKMVQRDHLSNEALISLMQKSDILIAPSMTENYPGVIAEGQTQGVRVVAHRVGGIPEMINDGVTGYLCQPNAESLASRILDAILDLNSDRVRASAFEAVLKRQNSEKIIDSHINLYTELFERLGG
jgi:glycosyltransferase involved in cell wall biosynthesis